MFLEPYLLTGPLRIIMFFVLILLIHRIISARVSAQTALNFLIPTITLILSAVLLGGFILVLTNTFDLFVIICIVIGLIALTFMNLNYKRPIKDQLQRIYTRTILYAVIKLEKRKSFLDRDNIIKPKYKNRGEGLSQFHKNWQLAIGFLLPVVTYISRSSMFNEDVFTLSYDWFNKLNLVNGLSFKTWFFHPGEMMGDYLIINLYAKLTHITNAQALQSFGLLESALLSLIIYWVVYKISRKHAPGILAGLSFALLYGFLPINIDLLAEHKSVFTALIIAVPTMFFGIYPQSFRFNRKLIFGWFVVLFTTILILDLFVGLLIVPIFLFILFFFKFKNNLKQVFQVILAYLSSLSLIAIIYGVAAIIKDQDIGAFVISNLFSFDAYTYNPSLVVPFKELIYYYQVTGIVFLLITIFKYIRKPHKWLASLIFLIFINVLFGLYHIDEVLLDLDLLSQLLCVFIPIFFGIILNIIVNLISIFKTQSQLITIVEVVSGAAVILGIAIFTFPSSATLNFEANKTENNVFEAYSKIQSENLPYSYAVVNSLPYFSFSNNNHYYYNYDYFNETYIQRDRKFNRYKNNEDYLQNNPDIILPETMFVFIYKNLRENNRGRKGEFKTQQLLTQERIDLLEAKGRAVKVYYKTNLLEVYQIANRPRASNINELLF
ncbi:hypothetical protein SAMN05660776_0593 [Salegentibacter holothuriorum]|uniref:Glycosyltransferase RgtA/B/C/D-like domain-containing protein n=1 Tax=Salegentibacter holothuriorum TaxID=241145 RepID=A0A1T5AI85_9FLAO|nr:hypothetical protein [Salegentibacter holothuriorum]SKB34732.1 hypothetical protein SAMN05660776_0593 [Salegentibacter holothuriorum]